MEGSRLMLESYESVRPRLKEETYWDMGNGGVKFKVEFSSLGQPQLKIEGTHMGVKLSGMELTTSRRALLSLAKEILYFLKDTPSEVPDSYMTVSSSGDTLTRDMQVEVSFPNSENPEFAKPYIFPPQKQDEPNMTAEEAEVKSELKESLGMDIHNYLKSNSEKFRPPRYGYAHTPIGLIYYPLYVAIGKGSYGHPELIYRRTGDFHNRDLPPHFSLALRDNSSIYIDAKLSYKDIDKLGEYLIAHKDSGYEIMLKFIKSAYSQKSILRSISAGDRALNSLIWHLEKFPTQSEETILNWKKSWFDVLPNKYHKMILDKIKQGSEIDGPHHANYLLAAKVIGI